MVGGDIAVYVAAAVCLFVPCLFYVCWFFVVILVCLLNVCRGGCVFFLCCSFFILFGLGSLLNGPV